MSGFAENVLTREDRDLVILSIESALRGLRAGKEGAALALLNIACQTIEAGVAALSSTPEATP